MAFITLRRSRNTSSYYLVESYRDGAGKSRKRTLCYLGREQDGTDTLEKALAHWRRVEAEADRGLRAAPAAGRSVLQNRIGKARHHIDLLSRYAEEAARAERSGSRLAEDDRRRRAEEAEHWQAIERLRCLPSAENARAAKRAFRTLALRLHPDQGGSHEAFIRLKTAYDRADVAWRRAG